jgi:hypothetical protein
MTVIIIVLIVVVAATSVVEVFDTFIVQIFKFLLIN